MAQFRFGGGASETILNPVTAVLMAIAIVLILSLPRDKAIVAFVLSYFTIPEGQVIVLAGLHFTVLQILILTVLARMAGSKSRLAGGFNAVDKVVVLWALLELTMFVLQWQETQAFIRALADLVLNLGGYLAVRFLVSDRETFYRTIKALAAVCVVQGLCMAGEVLTYRNIFAAMGANSPAVRDGHVRAEGAMGGLYAAALAGILIPMFLWLWQQRQARFAGAAGLLGATVMVLAAHTSTGWLAYGGSLIGLSFWPLRKNMRMIRWIFVAILVGLHLSMNGPVWSLIEKIDVTGGSSSYHRYMLIDNCIRHFSDWWLIGYRFYGNWGFDMWDLCNQFVVAALTGGLVTLVTFITIYKRGFGALGNARKKVAGDRNRERLLWSLGSSLFALVVASFGINYMYHLLIGFFLILACISVATFETEGSSVGAVEDLGTEEFFGAVPLA